jgi:gliding motility-associated-like protein
MTIYKRLVLLLLLLCGSLHVFGQCTLSVSVAASNNNVICSGNSVVLTATATGGTSPYTYIWSTGETSAAISVNKGGTYTVSVSDETAGCQPVTQDITVTETASPVAPTVPDVVVCQNASAVLRAVAPGGNYQWYDAPVGGNLIGTGDTYTTPPIATATTFFVETSLGGCTGPRAAVNVTLSGKPIVSGAQICAGNTAVLHVSGGDNYTWYDAPGGTAVGTGPAFTTPPLTANTNYYVVSVINGCASGAIPVPVVVTPYPLAPTVLGAIAICASTPVNLHADASGVIDWFDVPVGGTSLITSPDYTTPALTATTTYYVQNSLNGCVSQRTAVTITVNAIPDAPTAQAATICAGTSTVLTATSTSGGGINWYADANGITLLSTGNTFQTPALNNTTTYYARTVNGSCISTLTPVQVTVTPNPPAPTATVTPVCINTPSTLTAITPGGDYAWFDAATGGNQVGSGETFTTAPLTAKATYYLQTTINGCISTRTAVTATVLPPAAPPVVAGATVCEGTSASLLASGSDNYQWYDAPVDGILLTAGQVFVTPDLTANATYYVQTVRDGCTSTRTAVNVTVTPIPAAPVVNGTNICPGNAATLTTIAPAGSTAKWYDAANGGNLLATGNSFTTPVLYDSDTYYVENVTASGCASTRTAVTVSTTPIVYPQFQYQSGTFCKTSITATPIISDTAGGTFRASGTGLVLDSHSGKIDIAGSAPGVYQVTFFGNESCHSTTTTQIAILDVLDSRFSYNGPYCQYAATNPSPGYATKGGSGGVFTVFPTGLVFLDKTSGVIDLKKSKPGNYTVTNTIPADGTCAVSISTAKVVIVSGVSVYAGPDQTVKAGTPVQLAGNIAGGVTGGKWTGGTGRFSNASLNPIYTPGPGETKVTLTLTSDTPAGDCGAKSDQVVITIVPAPTAPTAAGATTCMGSSVTLSATAPGGSYAWYDAATGGKQLGTGANFTTPALTATTTYYVQTTISVNTSNRTPVTVTVNARPDAPTAAAVSTCYNNPATLTAQGSSGNYQWYDAAIGGSFKGTGSNFTTPALTSNVAYYVQAVNNGCVSTRTKVPVTITHAPVFSSAASGTVCSGTALNYTITSDVPSAVYTWERPQVAGISNAAVASHTAGIINETLINTGTTAVNVIYNITAADGTCTTPLQYVVTVNPTPTVTSVNKLTICNEAPLNYTITFNDPDASFTWARAAVDGVSNASISGQAAGTIREVLHNTSNAPVDVVYVVTYSKGQCSGTFNFTVTVNPFVYLTSVNTTSVCNGNLFNYQIIANAPAATFNWRRDADPNITNPPVNNQTSATINETLINKSINPVNVNYYIQPTINGCPGPVSQLIVTVYPIPATAVANSNAPVCVGSTIRLQTPVVTNASYLWTGPNGYTSTEQNPEISNATAANSGIYSLTIIINGCPGPPASTTVKVNEPSVAHAGPDQTVCITVAAVNLNGIVTGGSNTGIWTTSGSGIFQPNNGVLNAQYIPSDQDRANGSVALSLSSASKDDCAISTSVVNITFGPTPAVDAGSDLELCVQSNVIPLNGRNLKPGPVFWTSSGTGTFSAATQPGTNYIASSADLTSGSVTLTLHYTDASVCDIGTDETVIKFIPPPKVYAGGTRYVLKGHTITLEPTVSDDKVTYLWTPNINISDTKIKNPVITGDIDRVYTLTVTDIRGCVSQDQVKVKVAPLININNTFTPNGDGINDLWNITGLIAYADAVVDVFDRYGAKVYHSIGYDRAWDGTYNGRPLPTGTYYYVIRLNYNGQVLSGYVTVVR